MYAPVLQSMAIPVAVARVTISCEMYAPVLQSMAIPVAVAVPVSPFHNAGATEHGEGFQRILVLIMAATAAATTSTTTLEAAT